MKNMQKWYTINHGAIVRKETFDSAEEAELFAIALTGMTCQYWHVEEVVGYDF